MVSTDCEHGLEFTPRAQVITASYPGTDLHSTDPPFSLRSPAQELGLSGRRLDARVQAAITAIPVPTLAHLLERLRHEATKRGLTYLRDGEPETVSLFPYPIVVLPEQLGYLHTVTLTILTALKRLVELYVSDPAVRGVLPLTPGEDRWLSACVGPSLRLSCPVFGRLDAMVDLAGANWQDSLRYVEPNLNGVGGLHMVPTCERIVADIMIPALQRYAPGLRLTRGRDVRELFLDEVLDHARAIDRPLRYLCFVEPKYAGDGPDEQQAVAEYFQARHGLRVMHADPSELTLAGGEVRYEGVPVDIAYRDYSVFDLLELEQSGVNVEPMRTLFRQNRIISSIAGELDHKSTWEVLTSPVLAGRYFNVDERRIFRRHIPWTRLLNERQTELPDGRIADLIPWVRRSRERLVIKPNRSYGGEGVVIGPGATASAWDAVIAEAVRGGSPGISEWVVQELVPITARDFRIAGADGDVRPERMHMVMGFFASPAGIAAMARASGADVINVAQRGGLCAVLVGSAVSPKTI